MVLLIYFRDGLIRRLNDTPAFKPLVFSPRKEKDEDDDDAT